MSDGQSFSLPQMALAGLVGSGLGVGGATVSGISEEMGHCAPLIEHAVRHKSAEHRIEDLERRLKE